MTVTFGTTRQLHVHFDDLDPVGVVHNARYAVLLERAISLYWQEHGMFIKDSAPSCPDLVSVVREFAITFHAPIRSMGPIDVHFWLDKMGSSSAVYGFKFLSADHSTMYAEGKRVMVKIDPETGQPAPWTERGHEIGAKLLR